MNTVKGVILSILVSLVLSGCSVTQKAKPRLYKGDYYMVGDEACGYFRSSGYKVVDCFNSKSKHTERRYAMGPYALQLYNQKKSKKRSKGLFSRILSGMFYCDGPCPVKSSTSASLDELITPTPTNTLSFPNSTLQPNQTTTQNSSNSGTPIYTAGECKGSVVNNRCVGVIVPKPGYTKKCYGPIVLGECRGAYY